MYIRWPMYCLWAKTKSWERKEEKKKESGLNWYCLWILLDDDDQLYPAICSILPVQYSRWQLYYCNELVMYSVTIVWSAFAFIHLRLVSSIIPIPRCRDSPPPLGAVKHPATRASTSSSPRPSSHTSWIIQTLIVRFPRNPTPQLKLRYRLWELMFILIDVLSRARTWTDEASGGLAYCKYRLQ